MSYQARRIKGYQRAWTKQIAQFLLDEYESTEEEECRHYNNYDMPFVSPSLYQNACNCHRACWYPYNDFISLYKMLLKKIETSEIIAYINNKTYSIEVWPNDRRIVPTLNQFLFRNLRFQTMQEYGGSPVNGKWKRIINIDNDPSWTGYETYLLNLSCLSCDKIACDDGYYWEQGQFEKAEEFALQMLRMQGCPHTVILEKLQEEIEGITNLLSLDPKSLSLCIP